MKRLFLLTVVFFLAGCAQTKFLEKNFEFNKIYVAKVGGPIAAVNAYEVFKCGGSDATDEECYEVFGYYDTFTYGGMINGEVKIDYVSHDVERYGEYVNPDYTHPIFLSIYPGDTLWVEYMLVEVMDVTPIQFAYRILECEVPGDYIGTEWRTITHND